MDRKTRNVRKPRGKVGKRRANSSAATFSRYQIAATQAHAIRSSWTTNPLITSTTGTLSASYSASVAYSPEYSAISTLYTTVKLVAFRVTLIPKQSSTATVHDNILVATHASYNGTTYVLPTDAKGVENTQAMVQYHSGSARPLHYYMWLPKTVEYTNLTEDSPVDPTPYAGSPGAVVIFGERLTPSTTYLAIQLTAVWLLRGRY